MPSSVVTRSSVLMSTPVVAWPCVFETRIAVTRSFVATSIVIGLRAAASVHLFARHRTIVVCVSYRTRHGMIFGAPVMTSVCAGRDHSGTVKFSGARGRSDCGSAVILGREKLAVAPGAALVVTLHAGRLEMVFSRPPFLFARWTRVNSAAAASVADAVHGDVVDDGLVVDVNVGDGHVVHGAVVVEVAVSP